MVEGTRRVLAKLIRQKGTALAADARRLEALLRDLCPGHMLAINLLVSAARHGVPERLNDPVAPLPIRLAQQTAHLADGLGFAEDKARWAVETWAAVLGVAGAKPSPPAGDDEPPRAVAGQPPAVLVVDSKPAGATVLVNGEPVGPTPLRRALDLGSFTHLPVALSLTLAEHVTQETIVELRAGEETAWRGVRLGQGGRPANWPEYLAHFTLPAGMDWSSFRVSEVDGMPQVLVPAGAFRMGSPEGEAGRSFNEGPQKQVQMSAYWMDLHEVTNAQYAQFLNAKRPAEAHRRQWVSLAGEEASKFLNPQILCTGNRYVPEGGVENYPVVWVSWRGAAAYAEWAGRTLPTEAQWERAARGGRQTKYVWGDSDTPPTGSGNFCDEAAVRLRITRREPGWYFPGYDDGYATTSPVASFRPNAFGLYDMAGNVEEWCQDRYADDWYAEMPNRDPINLTQGTGSMRVMRGGAYMVGPQGLRVSHRSVGFLAYYYVGFRCAAPAS